MSSQSSIQRPTFSVVIPTYNRAEYLRFTLETCLSQDYSSVEFIIQDDDSTDQTSELAKNYVNKDSRFRYCNIGHNVGMRRNFESSLNNTSGDYLIFLGGDDAFIPESLSELAEMIVKYPSKIITWAVPGYYYDKVRNGEGQIVTSHVVFETNYEIEVLSKDYFEHQAEKLFYVNDEKSPMIYVKSAVPRSTIEAVMKASDGIFFTSSTPDGYSGFALASIEQSYIYTNRPFTMHGVSPSSQGLNYIAGSNDKNDHSKKFFQESKSIPMAPQLGSQPYSPLISLMTADFIFQTDNIFCHGYGANIVFENLIYKALDELGSGSFPEKKMKRELGIIHNIAKFQDKEKCFFNILSKSKRKSNPVMKGDMISPNVLILSAPRRNIYNVIDAAEFIFANRHRRNVYTKVNFSELIFGSLRYKMESLRPRSDLFELFDGEFAK